MTAKYMPRLADRELAEKLEDTGAVLVQGPKWCGKTETSLQACASALFLQDPDERGSLLQVAQEKPSLLLRGKKPRLLDEWQDAPQLWDAVRFAVDREGGTGLFVLTGSTTPINPEDRRQRRHSGAGRIAPMRMDTMSLWEAGDSTGDVSLAALFDGRPDVVGRARTDLDDIARLVCRGGWPSLVSSGSGRVGSTARSYLEVLCEEDVRKADGVARSPELARAVLGAYARCTATQATKTSMAKALAGTMAKSTFDSYVEALEALFVIDDLGPWAPSLRARSRVTKTPKRFFCDPSLAAAALGATPERLLRDMPTLGNLFESLCVHDLRVYGRSIGSSVSFFRDNTGLEADAVVQAEDGRWGLVEVKLGQAGVEDGARSLKKVATKVDQTVMGAPTFLMVMTGSGYAYRRDDGVLVVPAGCLRP